MLLKLKTELKLLVSFIFQCFRHKSVMVDANLHFSIFSIFPPLLESQLPTLAPRLRRNQERSVAENKTPRCYQYWLVGFRIWDWSTRWKLSDINDLGKNLTSRSGVEFFCILARLRRVLRTHLCSCEPQARVQRYKFSFSDRSISNANSH